MRIDPLEAQYEIPGFEIAPQAFEAEEAGDDYADAPFGLDAAVSGIPSPVGWQQLLGLTTVAPSAISIDPPTKKRTSGWRAGVTASHRLPQEAASAGTEGSGPSPSVHRMMAVLAQTRQTVARIRARAKEAT